MDDQALDKARQASSEAAATSADLRTQLGAVEHWRKLLESVVESAAERPAFAVATLAGAQDLIRAQQASAPDVVTALRTIWDDCRKRAETAAADSVRTFPEAAEEAGLRVDSSSRHPRYSLAEHFITVELLERDLAAKVEIRHAGRVLREPLDVSELVSRLAEEHRRLFNRPWDATAFFRRLSTAYKKHAGSRDGVPVRDLATAMAERGKKPRLDEFAIDLGRLLRDRDAVAPGVQITTNHTRDTARGLLLRGLEQGGYVLSLAIEEAF